MSSSKVWLCLITVKMQMHRCYVVWTFIMLQCTFIIITQANVQTLFEIANNFCNVVCILCIVCKFSVWPATFAKMCSIKQMQNTISHNAMLSTFSVFSHYLKSILTENWIKNANYIFFQDYDWMVLTSCDEIMSCYNNVEIIDSDWSTVFSVQLFLHNDHWLSSVILHFCSSCHGLFHKN